MTVKSTILFVSIATCVMLWMGINAIKKVERIVSVRNGTVQTILDVN